MLNSDNHLEDEFGRGNVAHIENLPVVDIVDDYDHSDPSTEYIVENILFEPPISSNLADFKLLKELFNSIYRNNCDCSGASCISPEDCSHGGNYKEFPKQDGTKELVLNESRLCKDLLYECYESCRCSAICHNRLVQYGPRKDLKVVDVIYNGMQQKGLITTKYIPKGGFICEYAGEILTKSEALSRHAKNMAKNKMNYIICLNECATNGVEEKIQTFIDPSEKGNIGRYLNHSCNPNCEILSVRIGSPLPRLGIFAKRDINDSEELCFHYGGEKSITPSETIERVPCCCGHKSCEIFLPNFSF